ncbi:MAG: DUF2800 domain-containing protein [Prevotellaceae bacterium]|nr:DUF2800 domain-containing protein [Candidatus Faecinaster equi]
MNWNDHSALKSTHAFLSPSTISWLNYEDDKLESKLQERYFTSNRTLMGTALHEFAADCITMKLRLSTAKDRGTKISLIQMIDMYLKAKDYSIAFIDFVSVLPDEVFQTLIAYVNDGIRYRMDAEKILYYSYNCYGTADAIAFTNGVLRISDLKTGTTPAHMEQLMIYAALFCLEYNRKPGDIKIELRLYQNGEILEFQPTAEDILPVMNRIIAADKILSKMKNGEE